jgi:hypothetical protein
MDLDNLKDKARQIKAPEAKGMGVGESATAAQNLIVLLKAADEQQLKMLRRSRKFMLIATGIFLFTFALTFLEPGSGGTVQDRRMMKGSLVCIYVLVTTIYFIGVKKLSRVDYSAPVRRFLEQAELRYRFMKPSAWMVSLSGLFFVGVITTLGYTPYLSRVFGFGENLLPMYLILPGFILGVAVMGFYFTWKNWERDRSPLWRRIKQMQQELENS